MGSSTRCLRFLPVAQAVRARLEIQVTIVQGSYDKSAQNESCLQCNKFYSETNQTFSQYSVDIWPDNDKRLGAIFPEIPPERERWDV